MAEAPAFQRRGRPCLAALEQLDDRLLLSAAPAANADQLAALVSLLGSELALSSNEVAVLKLAVGAISPGQKTDADAAFLKLEGDFLKLDGLILNASRGAVSSHKFDFNETPPTTQIQDIFVKINALLPTLSPSSQEVLLPAVQKVQDAALATLESIASVSALKINDHKTTEAFVKMDAELLKIDALVLKISVDTVADKTTPLDKQLPMVIDNTFVKIDSQIGAMGDGSVFKDLLGVVDQFKLDTDGLVVTLTTPVTPPTSSTTPFAGLALGDTGDTIG
jgi:hypothetical protein